MNFYDNLEKDGTIVVTGFHDFPDHEMEIKMTLRRIYDEYRVDYRYRWHSDSDKLIIRRNSPQAK